MRGQARRRKRKTFSPSLASPDYMHTRNTQKEFCCREIKDESFSYLTEALSTPMPKETVAVMTGTTPSIHSFCTLGRSFPLSPAW